ncbi:MAG: ATP-dependent DNA helicase [Lachnospiraceae bacterium]|nr:ATP-dependent DNA helicase [Lachnospiraceae bacterium]
MSINEEQKSGYEICLSVRDLVEFVFRSGDIDNRRTVSPEKAMQEGSRLHRMLQRSMGEGYTAEVLLKTDYVTENYTVHIEGRADGIIDESAAKTEEPSLTANQISLNQYLTNDEYPQITIDEIKTVHTKLERLREAVPVHLAQAKVYAYIYASQNGLPYIRVRMTYCNAETEELKYFFEEYTLDEISEWFAGVMKEYEKWAERDFEWHKQRQRSIEEMQFPFEYREGQKQLVSYVYQTISEKKKLFLEAPTGVGKTISTIFPALKTMGEGKAGRIFYLTARTITRAVAENTLDILRKNGLKLKATVITAKEKICCNDKVECNPDACRTAKGHFDRVNDAIYEALTVYDELDRETISTVAAKYDICPFEFSLDLCLFSDMIICDYNYVFDPHVYLRRFFSDGGSSGAVFLVDEAHNLVDRGREMYSAELYKEDFLEMKRKIEQALMGLSGETEDAGKKKGKKPKFIKGVSLLPKLIRNLEKCNREMLKIKRGCEKAKILDEIDSFVGQVEALNTSCMQFLDEEENTGIREELLEFWFRIGHFLLIFERLDENYRIYARMNDENRFLIRLFCVNPGKNLEECVKRGVSGIFFSATLLPIQYFKRLLGGNENDYEAYAKSAFDKNRLAVFIDREVTSKYSKRSDYMYLSIASHIYETIQVNPGNYIVFSPSFSYMEKLYAGFEKLLIQNDEIECIMQKEKMSEEERELFLSRFMSTKYELTCGLNKDYTKSLVGFCVLGGIFSEGIDLREDALIGSIIIGTGMPMVGFEKEVIKDFFGEKGFDYAYRIPGMNRVLQAAGRVIRTEEDRGIVMLMDERFLDRSYQRMFPREWAGFSVIGGRNITDALEGFWFRN